MHVKLCMHERACFKSSTRYCSDRTCVDGLSRFGFDTKSFDWCGSCYMVLLCRQGHKRKVTPILLLSVSITTHIPSHRYCAPRAKKPNRTGP
jgi:hypothetical protein